MARRIRTLAEIEQLRADKRAVTCPGSVTFRGPLPAAFIINLSGEIILRLIRYGLYVYTPKGRKVAA
jgi:hypothetical protein